MPLSNRAMSLTRTADTQASDQGEPAADAAAMRANRYDVLSRLADDLAHEIKNPLNAIVVNLEVLRNRIGQGNTESSLERAAVIDQEIQRVYGLVDQLLRLLRPSTSEVGLLAVDGVLESLATAIQIQAKAARVTLAIESEPDLYAQIRMEPFTFALLNLIVRAIDEEARTGGTVSVNAHLAAADIYVVVRCERGILPRDDESIRFCRILMREAGGVLESVEPNQGSAGSTATVTMPARAIAGQSRIKEPL